MGSTFCSFSDRFDDKQKITKHLHGFDLLVRLALMPLEDLGFQEVSKSFSLDTLKLAQVTPYRISYDGPDIYFATESEFESKPKSERDPRARREILEKSKTSKPITRNSGRVPEDSDRPSIFCWRDENNTAGWCEKFQHRKRIGW